MSSQFIVGILQHEFTSNPDKNLEIINRVLAEKYEKADIIILPEYSMINILGGLKPEEVYLKAEKLEDSSYLSRLSDVAGNYDTYILAHMIEKSEYKPKCYSTSVLVKPSGGFEKIYSKIHLFDAYGYRESNYLLSGTSLSKALNINGKKYFVAICYDIRFPELFRTYALQDAYGVFVHAGWVKGPLKEEILDKLASSRSHENTMYIVLANQTGEMFTGRSGVFNPYGYKALDLGFKPGYAEFLIVPELVDEARNQIPVVRESSRKWWIEFRGR